MEPTQLKKSLHELCKQEIQKRIDSANSLRAKAEESMMNETKSSAGDKFETARAMLQAEQDRLKGIIIKNKELAYQLSQVPLNSNETIQVGSLVLTAGASYFIAVGLGKLTLDEKVYYVISPSSPLGQLITGCKAGDEVTMNGRKILIDQIL